MREKYYKFIDDNNINDMLHDIYDIPYSKKLSIIKELYEEFPVECINMALAQYYMDYIRLKRVIPYRILNTLKYFCKKILKEYNIEDS